VQILYELVTVSGERSAGSVQRTGPYVTGRPGRRRKAAIRKPGDLPAGCGAPRV